MLRKVVLVFISINIQGLVYTIQCKVCLAKFTQKGSLNEHYMLHMDQHAYKCDTCGAKFKTRSSLKRHDSVHTKHNLAIYKEKPTETLAYCQLAFLRPNLPLSDQKEYSALRLFSRVQNKLTTESPIDGVKPNMGKDRDVVVEIGTSHVHSAAKGVMAAVLYGTCSISCAFSSKLVMDTMSFDYPVTIMVAQMIFTILVLQTSSILNIIDLPPYTLQRGMAFAAPAFFYGTNAVLALTALSHMNIVMYDLVKRCVPLSIMLLSVMVLKKGLPSCYTMCTVLLLTAGCVIGGYGDMGFNLTSYLCGITSNFTQALYLLLVQRKTEQKMTVVETLQLNAINTLPLLITVALVKGELSAVPSYPRLTDPGFCVAFFLAISMGMMLNYSLFLCTHLTSALTTSIVGGFKALAQTLLGIVTFGGVANNWSTVIGVTLNLTGGVGYIIVRYFENKSK